MAWQKGQSGNPKGQPKKLLADGRSLRDLAREHTEVAIMALVKIVQDDEAPPAAIVSASTALLDRGWGKPTQPISGDDDMPAINWIGAPIEALKWAAAQAIEDDATAH